MLQDGKISLTIGGVPFFFLGNIWLDDGNLKRERLVKAGNSGMTDRQQEKIQGRDCQQSSYPPHHKRVIILIGNQGIKRQIGGDNKKRKAVNTSIRKEQGERGAG